MSFLNGKEWGSKGNQVLDFFPRIVDVGAEMTFANTQENRKKPLLFSPHLLFWPDQTFAIENISYLLQERKSMSNFLRAKQRSDKKESTENSWVLGQRNFAVLLQRQFPSQKSLLCIGEQSLVGL